MPLVKIKITAITTVLMLIVGSIIITSVSSSNNENNMNSYSGNNGYIDISVVEAWEMLNDTSNGIQYPIDVRTDPEWIFEHIDTPKPENPKHHNFYEWVDTGVLNEFLTSYQGEEIIIYCRSGSRSVTASNILIDNNFDGTIYNMLGGITAWTSAGLPTIPNRPPDDPNIFGSSIGKPGVDINFSITSHDPDEDMINYCINWNDSTDEICIGPYNSDEEVNVTYNWIEEGPYQIQVKAIDEYNEESNWTTFDVSISQNTELEINDVRNGIGFVEVDIKNNGDVAAEEVAITISIKGGLFNRIDIFHECIGCVNCDTNLEPGSIKTESSREGGILVGFGNVEIIISSWANNADIITEKLQGFAIGPIIRFK